jgi:hypothetical protein
MPDNRTFHSAIQWRTAAFRYAADVHRIRGLATGMIPGGSCFNQKEKTLPVRRRSGMHENRALQDASISAFTSMNK